MNQNKTSKFSYNKSDQRSTFIAANLKEYRWTHPILTSYLTATSTKWCRNGWKISNFSGYTVNTYIFAFLTWIWFYQIVNLIQDLIASPPNIHTCFADPVYIAVKFPLQLLLSSQFEKGLPILHTFPFLGKFSAKKKSQGQHERHRLCITDYRLKVR